MSKRQSIVVRKGRANLRSKVKPPSSSKRPRGATTSPNGATIIAPPAPASQGVARESTENLLKSARAFKYDRMFATGDTDSKKGTSIAVAHGTHNNGHEPDPNAKLDADQVMKGLTDLGLAMHQKGNESIPNAMPCADQVIPAGYTYLGQFITHDITFDKTSGIADGELSSLEVRQGRTPSLELDSLYGMGPLSASSRHLYEDDRLRFRIGETTKTLLGTPPTLLPNDLPRDRSNQANPRKAQIADSRNDRNLALAQTHLAFMKFHNVVVNHLASEGEALGRELFVEARKIVIQHYQSIILDDYLPKIIDPSALKKIRKEVLARVAENGMASTNGDLFLPIEFAHAAFRFGHSMVRDQYEWNRVFHSPKTPNTDAARLHHLFTFTGLNGNMQGALTLPTNWVIDWRRFYKFEDHPVKDNEFNLARKISPSLSLGLKGIPGFPAGHSIDSRSVAVLDLQLGAKTGLPSGQEVAKIMEVKHGLKPHLKNQIAKGPNDEINKILVENGFDKKTPLWFYILREAESEMNGRCLGQVGARIVAETIIRVINASEYSILREKRKWKPSLPSINSDHFEMTDMLAFVNDLNPLRD